MRTVVVAAVVASGAASSGETMSCSGPWTDHETELSWTIPDGPGSSGVDLIGCGDWDVELGADAAVVDAGWLTCAVRGWRQDGRLRVFSTPVKLDGDERAMHITFDLPAGPIAGMGAEFRPMGSMVLLTHIVSGSPADLAGLRPGDRVVKVDDTSTEAMSSSQFIRVVTGAPGTPVELWVSSGGELRHVQMERARIE
ncbi:MAG: PDZ domain-containing protein [Myxococcales bacterium]|nr:PDZ domain-containing protein [Myxococcales bacterium]